MDVKIVKFIFLESILIQASIIGIVADKIIEKDGEVPKLAKQGNNMEKTAAVRAQSLKNILQERFLRGILLTIDIEQWE